MARTLRSVELLRAINVGGHPVKVDHLRSQIEVEEISNVQTFIVGGNVMADAVDPDGAALERAPICWRHS
jgi:uncharacterized protein (DUF1697 family)